MVTIEHSDGHDLVRALGPTYDLSSALVPTGWEVWIASQKMPGIVPRLAAVEGTRLNVLRDDGMADEDRIAHFYEQARHDLDARSERTGRSLPVVNLGYLPLVQGRGGAFDRRDRDAASLEEQILSETRGDVLRYASVSVPGDPQRRAYGILMPLAQGIRSVRRETFYGPSLHASGEGPTHQFFTGDTFVTDPEHSAHTSPLSYRFPDVARMLRAESTYVALVDLLD